MEVPKPAETLTRQALEIGTLKVVQAEDYGRAQL